MRAEEEKARIDRARAAITKLATGVPFGMVQIFDGGPVGEWQVRLVKRLQRENMVGAHPAGFHANSIRMVNLLKATANNTPAIVELLWPERAKDVLKGLTKLAPEPMPEPAPVLALPPELGFDVDNPEAFRRAVTRWASAVATDELAPHWSRVKELLPLMAGLGLFPKGKGINEQWIMLGQVLSSGARRLQEVSGVIVERRNGPGGSTEYRLIPRFSGPAQPVEVPEPQPPPPPASEPEPVEARIVRLLREHGPMTKRDLQDKIGGKRQPATEAVEDAISLGYVRFGVIYGHPRARVYLGEHLDAAQAAFEADQAAAAVAEATTDEQPGDDTVDDDTFKSTTLKYLVIYGQNFITVADHFRVLHETTARLEAKLDALMERLEKKA